MARSSSRHPTQAELQILQVLWSRGPSTVRQVLETLPADKPRAYTSVMTLMTIMTRKRYLTRRKLADGGYLYTARVSEQATGKGMLRDLIDRVFRGSTVSAMLQLLDDRELDADEVRQLREMVDRKQKGKP